MGPGPPVPMHFPIPGAAPPVVVRPAPGWPVPVAQPLPVAPMVQHHPGAPMVHIVPPPPAGSQPPIQPAQVPFKELVYDKAQPKPTPLSAAPNLVEASDREGMNDDMIYVQAELADSHRPIEMIVDTGAQMSVISVPLAEDLGLMHLLDRSRQGIASGVGHARILGRLSRIPARLGTKTGVEFALDLMVLGVKEELLILGIDQLRRFQCVIDLQRNRLVFGGHGGSEVDFIAPPERHPVLHDLCSIM
eukprot:CAMPEP_0178444896 /NCGR_PEP_ID=MMETSP0689_2-20121128/39823_1 /TAXON_ID=160604 /ORGANISM="Amphidinium massartii, Strain CS-259" /LENGTH=246 /DNA_ID=CAMNT_0020069301 /DNA_START=54 /DNA_END=794 /DNA_ORIENTATION=-